MRKCVIFGNIPVIECYNISNKQDNHKPSNYTHPYED